MRVRSLRNSRYRRVVRVAVISCFIILIAWLMPKAATRVAVMVSYPFHAMNQWLENSSSLVPTFIRSRQALETQIRELEDQLIIAERAQVTQQRLYEENVELRRLLGDKEDSRIAAAVIGRPGELPYDLLQIDRGTDSGIKVGAPVFIDSDIVIGLVVHAAPNYAFVELFTTPGFEASAFITGPNVVATIEGMGAGVARVRVPQGIPLTVGNLVYLPSIDPGVFGRISYIENEPTQPEQYGYISPETAISGVHYVAVGQVSQVLQSVEEIDETIQELVRTQLKVTGLSHTVASSTTSGADTATSTSP